MMKVLKQILICSAMVVGLSVTAIAQKDDKKRPPKGNPPVVTPQPKNPPSQRPDDKKPKKPNATLTFFRNDE